MEGNIMKERDLKEMTLDRMIELGTIDFYLRDIDTKSIDESAEVINIVEMQLQDEQDVSNYIQGMLEFGLEKYFNIVEDIVSVNFASREYSRVELKSGSKIGIDDTLLLKILKGYLKEIGRDAEVLKKYTTKLCRNTELLYIIKDDYRWDKEFKYGEYNLFTCICNLLGQIQRFID